MKKGVIMPCDLAYQKLGNKTVLNQTLLMLNFYRVKYNENKRNIRYYRLMIESNKFKWAYSS